MATLFEERNFSWPDQPGNPQREAKLPWFWFTDVGEAKTYIQLWWLWQSIAGLVFLNVVFLHNRPVGLLLFLCAVTAQAAFLRVWIPLCRRANPQMSKWHWFAAGWFNPRSRHCLLMAWDLVQEAQRTRVGNQSGRNQDEPKS